MANPPITPYTYDAWARGNAPSGSKSKWHQLLEVRRFIGATRHRGRYSEISPGQLFGATICGQALPDPEWGTAPTPKRVRWAGMTTEVEVPSRGEVCLLCVEAVMRHHDSMPA